jgi:phytanoyl-CoA hydroxylase
MNRTISDDLWIDDSNAKYFLEVKDFDPYIKKALLDLMVDGITIVKGANSLDLCRQAIQDYQSYSTENREYVKENLDGLGREKRLVNFHLWSQSLARIGTNIKVMQILDELFKSETAVYTSLTFKYGTQQPVHRDTPHFATWPKKQFVGVWTALEDVDPDAGPLFYYPGGHKFLIEPNEFLKKAQNTLPESSNADQYKLALDLYNGDVIKRAEGMGAPTVLDLKAGDTVIWHPELPHGGTRAISQMRTRWSTVFHCAPACTQVHQHGAFFSHAGPDAPPSRYGYREGYPQDQGRKIALAGEVAFME